LQCWGDRKHVDVLVGNEEDLQKARHRRPECPDIEAGPDGVLRDDGRRVAKYPQIKVVATTLRDGFHEPPHVSASVGFRPNYGAPTANWTSTIARGGDAFASALLRC